MGLCPCQCPFSFAKIESTALPAQSVSCAICIGAIGVARNVGAMCRYFAVQMRFIAVKRVESGRHGGARNDGVQLRAIKNS
jgi:hypothetical protein